MDSVEWLAREVWAKVADKLPNVEMHVYGAYPSKRAMQLHNPRKRFHVLGQAKTLDVLLDYRVMLAPLRFGAEPTGYQPPIKKLTKIKQTNRN